MTEFSVGDVVRAKYMSDHTIEGTVVSVCGDDVQVQYEWEVVDHYVRALLLLRSVESTFIPDERFAREVRRSRLGSPASSTVCTSASTVRIRGGVSVRDRMGAIIEVWRWEALPRDPWRTDQRKVSELARQAVASSRGPVREKLSRQSVDLFISEHGAGVASRTRYRVVAA